MAEQEPEPDDNGHESPEGRPVRLPAWSGDFARQALANATGTLIAALTLFLFGVLFGAIDDVSTSAIVAASVTLASTVAAAVSAALVVRRYPEYRKTDA